MLGFSAICETAICEDAFYPSSSFVRLVDESVTYPTIINEAVTYPTVANEAVTYPTITDESYIL